MASSVCDRRDHRVWALHRVAAMNCKICGGVSRLAGVVDFNKTCAEILGTWLPLKGLPIYYRRCEKCGFVFTAYCDTWLPEAWLDYVYNQDYILIDPDYKETRPKACGELVAGQFGHLRGGKVLDYGSGSGYLAAFLRGAEFEDVTAYDPFAAGTDGAISGGPFDLVTCFEVLEHCTDPLATLRGIAALTAPDGVVLHSTLMVPEGIDRNALTAWWYLAPRNGHVSLFSRQALEIAWESVGFNVEHQSDAVHVARRKEAACRRRRVETRP